MWAAVWEAICSVISWFGRKPKERIEPVIQGYDGLMASYEKIIDTLEGRLAATEASICEIDGRLKHCESRHATRDIEDLKRDCEIKRLTTIVEGCGQEHQTNKDRIDELEMKIG